MVNTDFIALFVGDKERNRDGEGNEWCTKCQEKTTVSRWVKETKRQEAETKAEIESSPH